MFHQPVKNKQEVYEKLIEMSKMMIIQQDIFWILCITKIIINLLLQIYQGKKYINIPQKINFTGKWEEDDSATMLFVAERQQRAILNFSLQLLIISEQYKYWNIKKY